MFLLFLLAPPKLWDALDRQLAITYSAIYSFHIWPLTALAELEPSLHDYPAGDSESSRVQSQSAKF